MLNTKISALAIVFLAVGCGHVISSAQCADHLCTTYVGENGQQRSAVPYQVYSLPVTVADFSFAKSGSAPWSLTVKPRNIPDSDPRYSFRMHYNPHSGADDQFGLTINNGLLNSSDVETSTQAPDVAAIVSDIPAIMGASSNPSFLSSHRRVLEINQSGSVTWELFASSVSCSLDQLFPTSAEKCHFIVARQMHNVQLPCNRRSDANDERFDIEHLTSLFGPLQIKSRCTGATRNSGRLEFKYAEALIQLRIQTTAAVTGLGAPWETANGPAQPNSSCTTSTAHCFEHDADSSVYYRRTAPLPVVAKAWRVPYNFGSGHPVLTRGASTPLDPQDFAFIGAQQNFPAVIRNYAFGANHPRGVGGGDHHIYTFTGGVLEKVEVEHTGRLLGILRLPLTIFGIGDD